jgi:photosystem II stability/assembly factor-like uncharacterized protein
MPTPRNVAVTDMSRVWLMETGAAPDVTPEYMGVWKAGGVSWDFGESTAIEIPSDSVYRQFEEVESMAGTKGKPGTTLTARYARSLSDMLRMAKRECVDDIQIHIGACQDPQNFRLGWDKIAVYEEFRISNYSTEDLGAMSSDERNPVNESINIQAKDYYEIGKLSFAEVAATSVLQEVLDVTYCDTKSCGGECGAASDGSKKVFGLIKAVGGSPGLGSQVVFSADGGSVWDSTAIDTLAANVEPNRLSCFGDYLIVLSAADESHHYADRDEILLGTETWAEVTGYTSGKGPTAIWTLKPGYAWVVGLGGYVYFLEDATEAPTIQDAGSATAQDLADVHAYDEEHVMAVGASNAVIHTTDGATWSNVTGPAVGVNLTACWMVDENTWWVGTAGGQLFYTKNAGATWTEKAFSGSGAGVVRDIKFVTKQVGYLAHDTAAPAGRILRTISAGNSWYVLPEGTGTIPANDRINAIAVCDDPNIVIGGGLGDGAADGIMVKGTA